MKIRLDFVSNSSSSSFMLVGSAFKINEIIDAWIRLHPEDKDKYHEMVDGFYTVYDANVRDMAYGIANELGLECEPGISNYYDMWAIGLSFEKIKDDETKRQFIDRIENSMHKAFPNAKATIIKDGGYDG